MARKKTARAAKTPQKKAVKKTAARKAPAKKAARPVKKAATRKPVRKKAAKPPRKSATARKTTARKQAPVAEPIAEEVDPLLDRDAEPLKLVGGLERDAQLPTSLVPKPELPPAVPLTVEVQATPGTARHGVSQPANLLVLVTCAGWPVSDLTIDHFSVMEHFDVPGQSAPFSNNVTSFRNGGSGAYLLQVKPMGNAPWQGGQHLAQVVVTSPDDRHGQAAAKIIIR